VSICDEPKYTCGAKRDATTGTSKYANIDVSCSRDIVLACGETSITIQHRDRSFSYSMSESSSLSGYYLIAVLDLFETLYSPCWSGSTYSYTDSFSDEYNTTDVALYYLDLRNDIVVTQEVKNSLKVSKDDSTAPTGTISVFTGYDAQNYSSYVFESIPIEETVTYNLYIKGVVTELDSELINRAYPGPNLLMPSFPWSPWGIRIDTAWAKEIDWYRQDLRKGIGDDQDGDAYLFWPDWCQSCGKLSQTLDASNRDLIYTLDHTTEPTLSGSWSMTEIVLNQAFTGSVAVDKDKNIFYSIATPSEYYKVNSPMTLSQKLVVKGADAAIPTDCECDTWYPIAPL